MNWNSITATFLAVIFSFLSELQARRRWKATAASRVDTKPICAKSSNNLTANLGDTVPLICCIDGLGTREVIWRKENSFHPLTIGRSTFVTDPRLSVEQDPGANEWRLVIQGVQWQDGGLYHCQGITKDMPEINSVQIFLTVQDHQSFIDATGIQVSGTKYVERGNRIRLVCNATGLLDATHILDWYKEGNRIQSDAEKGIFITKQISFNSLINVLVITSSKLSDAGIYLCRSSDLNQIAALTVHVLNVPPTIGKRGTYVEHRSSSQSRNQCLALLLLLQTLNCI